MGGDGEELFRRAPPNPVVLNSEGWVEAFLKGSEEHGAHRLRGQKVRCAELDKRKASPSGHGICLPPNGGPPHQGVKRKMRSCSKLLQTCSGSHALEYNPLRPRPCAPAPPASEAPQARSPHGISPFWLLPACLDCEL